MYGKFKSPDIKLAFNEFVSQAVEGDYFAIQAFLPYSDDVDTSIDKLKIVLRDKFHLAVTSGYGPRFLHSTGQLHKGDGNKGLFIQFTSDAVNDLDVPDRGYSFGTLVTAQAQGDLKALRNNGRRVISIHLSGNLKDHIDYLTSVIKLKFASPLKKWSECISPPRILIMKISRKKFLFRSLKLTLGSFLFLPLLKLGETKANGIVKAGTGPDPTEWKNDEINISWIGHSTILMNLFWYNYRY